MGTSVMDPPSPAESPSVDEASLGWKLTRLLASRPDTASGCASCKKVKNIIILLYYLKKIQKDLNLRIIVG